MLAYLCLAWESFATYIVTGVFCTLAMGVGTSLGLASKVILRSIKIWMGNSTFFCVEEWIMDNNQDQIRAIVFKDKRHKADVTRLYLYVKHECDVCFRHCFPQTCIEMP